MIGQPITPAAEDEIRWALNTMILYYNIHRLAMVEIMEANELTIDNNNNTTINDALKGLLTAEAAALNSIVSITADNNIQ